MDKKYIALTLFGSMLFNMNTAQADGKDGIAAVVNGEKITVAEVREAYKANPQLKDRVSFEEFFDSQSEQKCNLISRLFLKKSIKTVSFHCYFI